MEQEAEAETPAAISGINLTAIAPVPARRFPLQTASSRGENSIFWTITISPASNSRNRARQTASAVPMIHAGGESRGKGAPESVRGFQSRAGAEYGIAPRQPEAQAERTAEIFEERRTDHFGPGIAPGIEEPVQAGVRGEGANLVRSRG